MVDAAGALVGIAQGGLIQRGVEAVRFGTKVSATSLILGQAKLTRKFSIRVERREKTSYTPQEIFREFSPYVVLIETK